MNYRLFLKEIHDLISVCDEEFSGQIKLYIPDETQPYIIYITVTPNKGLYEHASFEFSITVSPDYPNDSPSLKCYTPIIHPNIDHTLLQDTVCVNLLYSWESCYRIKDVIHAIIFLFYEPNLDDCLVSSSLFSSEESYRESVKLFLKGGIVDGRYYPPNKSWCEWQENSKLTEEMNTSNVLQETDEPNSPVKSQASRNSSQYCKELYARSESSLSNCSSTQSEHTEYDQEMELLFIETTIEKISSVTGEKIQTFKGSNTSRYFTVEFYPCADLMVEKLVINRSWIPLFPLIVDGKLNLIQKSSQFNPRIVRSITSSESMLDDSVYDNDSDNCEVEGEGEGEGDCSSFKEEEESVNDVEEEEHHPEFGGPYDFDIFANFPSDVSFQCDRSDVEQSMTLFKRIKKPWWWVFFQTRWAPFIAPGRFYYIEERDETGDTKSYTNRGTCLHLRAELNRLSTKYQNCDNLFLVDSLALSPFSPILNRITPIPQSDIPHRRFKFCWRSIEWLSLTWAWFPPPTTKESEHLTLPGAGLLTTMCWISNLIAYASRVELYHSCLGYSRRSLVLPMESMAISCLSPASLVCGHCPLLDGWPLWLLTHASRLMCSFMLSICVSLSDYLSQKSCSLHFVFDDSDEI